jgi:HrpA-like RNA helicase
MYNQSQIFHPEPLRQPERLPILEYKTKILELVKNNPVVIIVGETGSGKTTQLPLILQELLKENEKILITQPRRIAAISVAKYVAERIGCEIGEEVGYQIRFEDMTTEGTKINFVTDGILLRKIQVDPLLSEYSIIMIDEAHERSINIDLCLGLLKQIQKLRREKGLPELKIIISSATLEKEKFQNFFEDAPVLEVEGRMYEVKEHYLESPTYYIYEEAAKLVKKIIEETNEGDILIFMPGREEIEATAREIQKLNLPIEILQLYGDMPVEEQEKIFYPGIQRRVIIATNIAETSVTVPRIRYVIDSGLIKVLRYYPEKRYAALVTEKHSKAGCIQRKGRAGRLAPGEYYALFTKEDFESRKEFSEPEIKRSNLAHIVLYMKNLGIDNIEEFDFIDKPEKKQIDEAIRDLKILGALDSDGKITDIGKEMVEYPLDPRLARMIVEAIRNNYDCLYEICVITSFFGQRSVFLRPQNKEEAADKAHSRFKHPTSDFITFLKIWVEWKKNNMSQEWARENFLNFNVLIEANKIVSDLLKILGRNGVKAFANGYEEIERKLGIEEEIEKIEKCILAGLIGNVSRRFYRFQYERLLDEQTIYIFPGSSLMNSVGLSLFTFLELRESPKSGKKFATFCQKIQPAWLVEVAPHLYKVGYYQYDIDREGKVIEKIEIYFGSTKVGEDIIRPRNIEEHQDF